MKESRSIGRPRRRRLLAAVGTGGLMLGAAVARAAPLNTNLVVNGDFEAVNVSMTGGYNGPLITGWLGLSAFAYSHDGSLSTSGEVADWADGEPPPGAGHWYFSSNNAGDVNVEAPGQFYQDIDVSQGASGAAIASGAARFSLGAFMSSYADDNDFGTAHVEFRNLAGGSLGTAMINDTDPGPNNVWSQNAGSGAVPAGTATVRLSLYGTGVNFGPDGYIDNVSFSISVVPEPSLAVVAGGGLAVLALRRRPTRRGPSVSIHTVAEQRLVPRAAKEDGR